MLTAVTVVAVVSTACGGADGATDNPTPITELAETTTSAPAIDPNPSNVDGSAFGEGVATVQVGADHWEFTIAESNSCVVAAEGVPVNSAAEAGGGEVTLSFGWLADQPDAGRVELFNEQGSVNWVVDAEGGRIDEGSVDGDTATFAATFVQRVNRFKRTGTIVITCG